MAKGKKTAKPRNGNARGTLNNVTDYRFDDAKRKNIPPAKIAAEGTVPLLPKIQYEYSPRLAPVLRFDSTGTSDKLPDLLQQALRRALTKDEAKTVGDALRRQEPWLEWANKREKKSFEVDPVALHIHERVSPQAILRVAARQDVEPSLFADPQQQYHEAVQFYRHEIPWANRLILGDSLQVMTSLARREDLAGKVQAIYMDPPYGIRFGSNFQPEIGKRDVKDKEQDLTREPEMVKAYRDTWHLGIHSYLAYLRDRLVVARELLTDSGSIFVQIGDENVHLARALMDEVLGVGNFLAVITVTKTSGASAELLAGTADFLLWYAKKRDLVKYRQIYSTKALGAQGASGYSRIELVDGQRVNRESDNLDQLPQNSRVLTFDNLTSQRPPGDFPVDFCGSPWRPKTGYWKTNPAGMARLVSAGRVDLVGNTLRYVRYLDDFSVYPITNVWGDTGVAGFASDKKYVVQTNPKIIERCLLMTTDPGDVVLDPTCGSGTTAYVAEQWGRRWITTDTSRVSVAIARQRLMTAKFEMYAMRPIDEEDRHRNPNGAWLTDPTKEVAGSGTFKCKIVPHIALKSIAQNPNLDPIFAKHQPILDKALERCNSLLKQASDGVRQKLTDKLLRKQKDEGRKAVTDADRRRWILPEEGTGWEHWRVPFDTDSDWPKALADAVTEYRKAWRARLDEMNACIAANAEQEEMVDQPEVMKEIVRVSGPFTVEAVQPPEMSLGDATSVAVAEFDGAPDEMGTFEVHEVETRADQEGKNVDAYLDQMIRLLKIDGVRFPNNKEMHFSRLEPVLDGSIIHADGRWANGEKDEDPEGKANVGVVFGPQYGPVTALQVEDAIRAANRRGYDHLVLAGFSFDGAAQAALGEPTHSSLKTHAANIRPDVNPGMAGLLKEQPGSQLFTVFGQPRTRVQGPNAQGEYAIVMEGVDIYNPVDNSITPTKADKVAAWFVDGDYDGRTFCITQAFFPDKDAWSKLSKALENVVDPERFEALSGTTSLPFPVGKHKKVAVKVIDPRGNEVMALHPLGGRRG
jgi:adenine-specific DNA-methyltransferase